MAAEKSVNVADSVDEVIETVKAGKTTEFFKSLWENHQQEIINFGKILLLTLAVLLLTWIFSRMVKAFIWKATAKFEKCDESLRKLFYTISRCFIWMRMIRPTISSLSRTTICRASLALRAKSTTVWASASTIRATDD